MLKDLGVSGQVVLHDLGRSYGTKAATHDSNANFCEGPKEYPAALSENKSCWLNARLMPTI